MQFEVVAVFRTKFGLFGVSLSFRTKNRGLVVDKKKSRKWTIFGNDILAECQGGTYFATLSKITVASLSRLVEELTVLAPYYGTTAATVTWK